MRTTGSFVFVALCALAGCDDAPVVQIATPAGGALKTDRAPVLFEIDVIEEELLGLALEVDGVEVAATLDPPLRADCGDGCRYRMSWSSLDAGEGTHELAVVATDSNQQGSDAIEMSFEDVPTVTLMTPTTPDQLGVGHIDVLASLQDRGAIGVEVRVDGVTQPGAPPIGDCRFGCTMLWPWETAALYGDHDLEIVVTDAGGRSASVASTLVFDDLPYATAIEITNTTDTGGFSDLDVEVHLLDAATDAWLGCAGQLSGLEEVDDSDVRYDVLATFVNGTGAMLGIGDLAGRDVRFHVMEDDTLPCPSSMDLATDDIVGTSAPVAAENIAGTGPMAFGDVVHLAVTAGRPFTR
jgi:hypothetical protein